MAFRPTVNDKITINRKTYTFMEHPSAKGMPYGQTGRRATAYQVQDAQGQFHALKVFTKSFRTHLTEDSAKRIEQFAHIPGLQVCSRTVITPQNNPTKLKQYPDLEYAVLMPWVPGQTWQEIMLSRQSFTPEKSLSLARNLAGILAAMEAAGIAHCDLSGPNVLVNGTEIALVDVEDLYAPGLEKPEKLPSGSAGYGHKTAKNGLWGPDADRFAGAILIAEMLGWHDERVRRIAVGEQYFDAGELQSSCDRHQILLFSILQSQNNWISDLFSAAWNSENLGQCPYLQEWKDALKISIENTPQEVLSGIAQKVYESIINEVKLGNWDEVERQSLALKALAPGFAEVEIFLAQAHQGQKNSNQREIYELQKNIAELERQKLEIEKKIDSALSRLATLIPNNSADKNIIGQTDNYNSPPLGGSGYTSGGHQIFYWGKNNIFYDQFPLSLGIEFVKVPAGSFLFGVLKYNSTIADSRSQYDENELPEAELTISHDFYMARHPITNGQYLEYCRANNLGSRYQHLTDKLEHPIINVSWNDALEYIKWLNSLYKNLPGNFVLRLPNEIEWEKAARGTDGRMYPWGNQNPDEKLCNFDRNIGGTTAIGTYSPQGDSPYGCTDMSGNVWEWTYRLYNKNSSGVGILRGGSWNNIDSNVRTTARYGFSYDARGVFSNVGLRCCISVK